MPLALSFYREQIIKLRDYADRIAVQLNSMLYENDHGLRHVGAFYTKVHLSTPRCG
jgi:hypothetical protein